MGNPDLIALGPGSLYTADEGSDIPASLTAAWPAAWTNLGYTHEGSDFGYQLTTENVEVAEELDPVDVRPTGRLITLKFVLAEITASNLKRALNGGTIVTQSGYVTFEPPSTGVMTTRMYGWQSDDAEERVVFYKCFNAGNVEAARKKGATKAGIPFELTALKPNGLPPFRWFFDDSRA